MAKKVTIKLNSDGVKELLKSSAIQEECMKHARSAMNSLGDGYVCAKKNYPERSGAIVKATTQEAAKDNLDNNSIVKAVLGS